VNPTFVFFLCFWLGWPEYPRYSHWDFCFRTLVSTEPHSYSQHQYITTSKYLLWWGTRADSFNEERESFVPTFWCGFYCDRCLSILKTSMQFPRFLSDIVQQRYWFSSAELVQRLTNKVKLCPSSKNDDNRHQNGCTDRLLLAVVEFKLSAGVQPVFSD